jgi:hypothetical protein
MLSSVASGGFSLGDLAEKQIAGDEPATAMRATPPSLYCSTKPKESRHDARN